MADQASREEQDAATSLCDSCGICCDGSMFDFTPLRDDEVGTAEKVGLQPLFNDGAMRFAQPCPAFCGTCSIYAKRPKICRTFNCNVLDQHRSGLISFQQAQDIVAEAVRLRSAVDAAASIDEPWPKARERWSRLFKAGDLGDNAAWYLAMVAYNLFIDRELRNNQASFTAME